MKMTERQLQAEGFRFSGLFGMDYRVTMRELRKALKPHGLVVRVYRNRVRWGDGIWIKIEKAQ